MTVIWQQVADADQVEAPLDEVPTADRPGWLRRWLWLPALAVAVGVAVAQRLVQNPSGVLEMWLMLALMAALAVTAVASLVRYRDDQRIAQDKKSTEALRADARSVTGSVTVSEREVSGGTMLRGLLTYPRGDGAGEDSWSLLVADDDAPGPRPGDPVAVWWAPGSQTVVARYHRGWADELHHRTGGRERL